MKNKDIAFSAVRITATIMIFLCHICQYYGYFLSWWLNVGVQIFLTLSGYLYGKKRIEEKKKWLIKQFLKIYIPYILLVSIMIIVYFFLFTDLFDINKFIIHIFCLQGIYGSLPNLYHLWYITYILVCYMLTPIMQKTFKKNYYLSIFLYVLVVFLLCILSKKLEFLWIINYIIGYAMGKSDLLYKLTGKKIILMMIIVIIISWVKIAIQDFNLNSFEAILCMIYGYFEHISLGLFLFLLIYYLEKKLHFIEKLAKFLPIFIIDNLSYEIYLIHQIFILGTFSILMMSKNIILNYTLLIIVVFFYGVFIKLFGKKNYKIY